MVTVLRGLTRSCIRRFARQIKAKRLVLTHFSARYRGDDSEHSMRTMWKLEDAARSVVGYENENDVMAAWDLMVYPIYHDDE